MPSIYWESNAYQKNIEQHGEDLRLGMLVIHEARKVCERTNRPAVSEQQNKACKKSVTSRKRRDVDRTDDNHAKDQW